MSRDLMFLVKLNDNRRLEVNVVELSHLIDSNAVEIIPNGGFPAVFAALGRLYDKQNEMIAESMEIVGEPGDVAPEDREWYATVSSPHREAYDTGRKNAWQGLSRSECAGMAEAHKNSYERGYDSVPYQRRGESKPRPVRDRPQA